ncbi:MAG: hypothetical protein WD598_14765 [Acidimicrobiia bacterium]
MSGPVAAGAPAVDDGIDWRTCARGTLVGIAVIVPTTILRAVLDREIDDFDDSGWIYPLFVLILIGYLAAGWVAGRARPDLPLMHGTVAGLGVFVVWVPARVVIWAVRDEGRELFLGRDAALRPGQVFGHLVIAAAMGMLGAVMAARLGRRRATDPQPEPRPR